jgi:outer membrane receptor for ferrienterochelin and colicin
MLSRVRLGGRIGMSCTRQRSWRTRVSSAGSLVVAAAMMLTSSRAFADARTEARSHFKKGMEAIADGRYEVGIGELKRANEILPHPSVIYNIARAYAESGDLANAALYYHQYLDGDPTDRDEVGQIVQNIEARMRRQQAAAAQAAAPTAVAVTPGTPVTPGRPGIPAAAAAGRTAKAASPIDTAPSAVGAARTEDVFDETVVTASRAAQSPLDAPNSTSIVTEQDIRLSGITKIPELLRRLAGVDIMEVTGGQTEVSLRGFNQRLSNKVLVLVDGRSVYVDLLGATLWAVLSVAVEDIDRIEVVRGPASALYGADAFNGVINIITKRPGEGGNGVAGGFGDHDITHGSLWASGRDKDFAWRASAGYDYIPRWSREVPNGRSDLTLTSTDQNQSARTTRLDLRATQQVSKDVLVGLGGGLTQGDDEFLGVGPLNDIDLTNFQNSDITAYVNSPHLEARAFWNRTYTTFGLNAASIGQSVLPGAANLNVIDGDVQGIEKFETGKGIEHDARIGLEYRYKSVDWTYIGNFEAENHESVTAQDSVKLGKYLGLVANGRVDYDPYLEKFIGSPHGTVLVHPTSRSTIRGIVGTAFRTPTLLEEYLGLSQQLPDAGASFVQSPLPADTSQRVQPEQVFSTELGYLNQDSDFFTLDTAVFYNRITDLTQLQPVHAVTVGSIQQGQAQPSGVTGLYPALVGGFDNQCQAYNVYGAELGARVYPVEGLDLYGNYTFNDVDQDNSGCSAAQLSLLANDSRTSAHKVNVGVQVRTKPGIDGSIDFHYVSPQTWAEQVTEVQEQRIAYQSFHLDAYTLLNGRIGYRFFKDKAEISAVGFNILGVEHREHPFGQLIGRRVMGLFSYKF